MVKSLCIRKKKAAIKVKKKLNYQKYIQTIKEFTMYMKFRNKKQNFDIKRFLNHCYTHAHTYL